PLDADIEQTAFEGQRDRKAAKDVWRGPDQRVGNSARLTEGAFPQALIGLRHIAAGNSDDEATDGQRRDYRQDRNDQRVEPRAPASHVCRSLPAAIPAGNSPSAW